MYNLRNEKVKVNKPCHCFGCNRSFKKGSIIRKLTFVDDGDFQHTNWCAVCDQYWTEYMFEGDVIDEGWLKSEDEERWEEIRKKIEGEINVH